MRRITITLSFDVNDTSGNAVSTAGDAQMVCITALEEAGFEPAARGHIETRPVERWP